MGSPSPRAHLLRRRCRRTRCRRCQRGLLVGWRRQRGLLFGWRRPSTTWWLSTSCPPHRCPQRPRRTRSSGRSRSRRPLSRRRLSRRRLGRPRCRLRYIRVCRLRRRLRRRLMWCRGACKEEPSSDRQSQARINTRRRPALPRPTRDTSQPPHPLPFHPPPPLSSCHPMRGHPLRGHPMRGRRRRVGRPW